MMKTAKHGPGPGAIVPKLFAIRTLAAGNGLKDLDLFAVLFDQMADVDDAIGTGVGALKAGVMRLYGVVVILGGWVRAGCAILDGGHEDSPFVVRASGCATTCGATYLSVAISYQTLVCKSKP